EWFDGPLALSGSISTGAGVLAAQVMGADFAYIGSAFIATEEARCDDRYKQAVVDYNSDDIVYTNLFTGVHGNYLTPSIRAAGLDPDNLPKSDPSRMVWTEERQSKKWDRYAPKADTTTDITVTAEATQGTDPVAIKAWKDVWGCGQGIGAVKKVQSTADYVAQLRSEYETAKASIR
ncbi:MAG TPA: nitronate monooxygenase, partial [Sphingomicrobium sp.]